MSEEKNKVGSTTEPLMGGRCAIWQSKKVRQQNLRHSDIRQAAF